ncbi:MAG TPA: AAA family ATPase [Thermoplasmata archaeon]|nr:AAA family ATPase [Thermoplasmata archaeon]
MPRPPRRPGPILAIEGPSAVGKTTLSRAVARALGGRVVPEAFRRLRPAPSLEPESTSALERLELQLLREEARRSRVAQYQARGGRPVVLDTGFLGPYTYTEGLAWTRPHLDARRAVLERTVKDLEAGRLVIPTLTVYLDAPLRTRRQRARADPGGHPVRLRRRHERVSAFERRFWREVQRSVAPERVRFVRAAGRIGPTAQRICDRVGGLAPYPPTAAETRRWLRFLRSRRRVIVKKGSPSGRLPR